MNAPGWLSEMKDTAKDVDKSDVIHAFTTPTKKVLSAPPPPRAIHAKYAHAQRYNESEM